MIEKTSTIKIENIFLDLNNPRYVEQQSESDAIAYLIDNEDIKPLAKNIAEIGSISPLELMALVPHPKAKNSYVTAEGNRRLCALKLLIDPDKAKNKKDKEYFNKLKIGMKSKIAEIPAIIFKSFDLARPWVELRHDPQTGVGTKKWNTEQIGRFNQGGRADSPNATAISLIDYAKVHKLISDDILQNIQIREIQSGIDRQRESLMMLKKYQVEFDNLDERIIGYIEASNNLERSIASFLGKK